MMLSSIFLVYTMESISTAFFVTAGTFGAMSLYGYFTKSSLTTQGAGIELKRSFSKFRELFTIRKKKKP